VASKRGEKDAIEIPFRSDDKFIVAPTLQKTKG
jgi:hypothetical protein